MLTQYNENSRNNPKTLSELLSNSRKVKGTQNHIYKLKEITSDKTGTSKFAYIKIMYIEGDFDRIPVVTVNYWPLLLLLLLSWLVAWWGDSVIGFSGLRVGLLVLEWSLTILTNLFIFWMFQLYSGQLRLLHHTVFNLACCFMSLYIFQSNRALLCLKDFHSWYFE